MTVRVLALDYDGTIADHGRLDPEAATAIGDARRSGIAVVLVTGRILAGLERDLPDLRLFDSVVAENGAVVMLPASGRTTVVGPPAPRAFLEALKRYRVPHESGQCLVAASALHAPVLRQVIRELGLELAIIFNRGSAMMLPQGISKASGLDLALSTLHLSADAAVGIGDGENDIDLLERCGVSVAVAWGAEALKEVADEVLAGDGPAAVGAYIRRLVAARRI